MRNVDPHCRNFKTAVTHYMFIRHVSWCRKWNIFTTRCQMYETEWLDLLYYSWIQIFSFVFWVIYICIHIPLIQCNDATFCFLWFTNCVLLFDKNLILGCLWLLVFVLNNIFILGIWCSTIPHLPGCFCPWTFFENIGFNTVLTDPFMSHLTTQLGYSAGEFQALQLIVLAAFGVVD